MEKTPGLSRPEPRSAIKKGLLIALVALLCLIAAALVATSTGQQLIVTIHNDGPDGLYQVIVRVTGHQYAIEDIDVGESRSVVIEPTGESDVHLHFRDAQGNEKEITAGCYVEHGYTGTIEIDVKDNSLERVERDVF